MEVETFVLEMNINKYLSNLIISSQQHLKVAKRKEIISTVSEMIKNRKTIIKDDIHDKFHRYSTNLDNSFFKTLKELRLQQEYAKKQ